MKSVKAADASLPLAANPPGAAPFLSAAAASPALFAEGTPRLGLVALIRPGLAAGRCLHLFGQLLRAAGRDNRSLAADRDPHAFQGIKQNAPSGEPGPELAYVVSRMGVVTWHGIPQLLRASLFPQPRPREPGPPANIQT